jgi:hypothetical protein
LQTPSQAVQFQPFRAGKRSFRFNSGVKVQADSAPDKNDPFYRFFFRDGADAERVQKAIIHAAELCGAGKGK